MNVPTIPFKSEFKDLSAFFASTYYDRIEKLINNAQQEIKNNEYLLAEIPLNDNTRITVRDFGYYNPTIMRVWGFNSNKEDVELLKIAFKSADEGEDLQTSFRILAESKGLAFQRFIMTLDSNTIVRLCDLNTSFRILCENKDVWEILLKRDFPNKKPFKGKIQLV